MGTTALLAVWVPISLTMLTAGALLLRHADDLGGSDAVRFETDPSPAGAGGTLPSFRFLDPDRSPHGYRLMGVAMVVGSALALLVGTVGAW